jgi:L-2-hydroxyglutarate oxidase LhgO
MEKINTVVIGAGAIGLAIAYELSKTDPDLVVVEKESSFGRHTSSRNSEVIHAGHYYNTGSLKARLCVEGNALLYDYLKENGIAHKNTGKIIVATNEAEKDVVTSYLRRGEANGCSGFRMITADEAQSLEPSAKCKAGLFIPSTGIFDTHEYMRSLAENIEEKGAFIVYGDEVTGIVYDKGSYILDFASGEQFQCKNLINSAGLWADRIAAMAGMDIEALKINQHWCKGQYYKTTKLKGIDHLIYPVADPKGIFLGIHLTINLAGEVRFGPNAFYVDEIDYRFENEYFDEFYKAINRYIDIPKEDLMPDDVGIRPKLQGPNDGFRDFYIQEESSNGFPGLVNLIGMESPGLTASLAIAKYVSKIQGN